MKTELTERFVARGRTGGRVHADRVGDVRRLLRYRREILACYIVAVEHVFNRIRWDLLANMSAAGLCVELEDLVKTVEGLTRRARRYGWVAETGDGRLRFAARHRNRAAVVAWNKLVRGTARIKSIRARLDERGENGTTGKKGGGR